MKDTNTYWTLTKYGDYLMTQLPSHGTDGDRAIEKHTLRLESDEHLLTGHSAV